MVYLKDQIYLDFYFSPVAIDRAFVKRFAAALLTRIRRIVEESGQNGGTCLRHA